ncbi:MAG TPA: VOC family protein [Candidatus Cybelea sp.]|nr:VOC family protein [Candidatus Cybelea sp.]
MPLASLDHVTVLCADVDRSRKFYNKVLGMLDGDRPPFDFPGAWLYVGERPVVHLIGDRNHEAIKTTGSFDHVAFDAKDLGGMRKRLKESGVEFTERKVPGRPLHQVFLHDPDGVMIELNFRGEN